MTKIGDNETRLCLQIAKSVGLFRPNKLTATNNSAVCYGYGYKHNIDCSPNSKYVIKLYSAPFDDSIRHKNVDQFVLTETQYSSSLYRPILFTIHTLQPLDKTGNVVLQKEIRYNDIILSDELKLLIHLKRHASKKESKFILFPKSIIICKSLNIEAVVFPFMGGGDGIHYSLSDFFETSKDVILFTMILKIAVAVCTSLNLVWNMNFVHGDIKPANILFESKDYINSNIYLIDWGNSCNLSQQNGNIFDITTPWFVPPEVHYENNPNTEITTYSDVWAVGCTFYYLLTGQYFGNFNGIVQVTPTDVYHSNLYMFGPQFEQCLKGTCNGTDCPDMASAYWYKDICNEYDCNSAEAKRVLKMLTNCLQIHKLKRNCHD